MSAIAGRDVSVHCPGPIRKRFMYAIVDGAGKDAAEAADGLGVLAHEFVHLRGVMNGGAIECDADTRVGEVARRFGLTSPDGERIARWQATVRVERVPDRYRACFG